MGPFYTGVIRYLPIFQRDIEIDPHKDLVALDCKVSDTNLGHALIEIATGEAQT